MGTQVNNGNAEQEALAAIEAQYNQAKAYIQAMKNDTDKIKQDQSIIAQAEAFGWLISTTALKSIEAPYIADEDAAKADLKAQGDALKALDPSFSALCDSLNALIDCIDKAANDPSAGVGNVMDDITKIQPEMDKILDAMQTRLQGDMYIAEMDSAEAGQLTSAELAQLASTASSYFSREVGSLMTVFNSLSTMIQDYQKAYNAANEDYNRYNMWDDVASFFGGDADEKKAEDKAIMANATDMMNGLSDVMTAMLPAISACSPEFAQALQVIKEVLREVKKILASAQIDPKEKEKLVLALVMFLLTFFQVVKQDVESEKMKNNQTQSQGAMAASKINIDNTMANEKIKEEQEANAKIMKLTMEIATAVMGAVMMVVAPGIGTALLIAMVTVFEELQTEGLVNVTGALAGAIGGKNAQIYADAIVAVIEMVVTMGGGALLDVGLTAEKAAQEVADKAMESAMSTTIKKAAEAAAQAAGKAGEGFETAVGKAMSVLDNICSKAAYKAAEGAAAQFMKQPFGVLMTMIAKGTYTQALKAVMEKAAQEAIETAIEDAATIAKLAARDIESSPNVIDEVATRAANETVASLSGKSFEKIAEEAAATKLGTAVSRGAWTALFAYGNTNMLTDMLKKMGVSNDTVLEIMQVMQQLIQMVAMMMGSGMMSGATIEGVVQGLPRIANLASLAPQSVQVAGSYGMYETEMKESKAIKAIAMDGSIADLLHSFIEQLQKDANMERDVMTRDQTQDSQSTLGMAGHLHDGDNAMIQILVSAAG